ncbi:MAG: DUF2147 domain-containing protein [Gammaproteobacteria bacterium]|nr:DUF2147 domain-containing protein [Gammaproteobacteria bacterium]
MLRSFALFGAFFLLPGAVLAQSPDAMPAATPMAARASSSPADAANGLWVTPGGRSRVQIARADDGTYRGRIVWLREAGFPQDYDNKLLAGKPRVDIQNSDASLRSRPILGLAVLSGFRYSAGDKAWQDGKCYAPEKGKSYDCSLSLGEDGKTLNVRISAWFVHQTETWQRYRSGPATAAAASKQGS